MGDMLLSVMGETLTETILFLRPELYALAVNVWSQFQTELITGLVRGGVVKN